MLPRYYRDYYDEGYRVQKVFENTRVLVTAHRLPQFKQPTEPFHWHARELMFVYLSGGNIAGSSGYLEARRARRGEFDILPADLPHVLQNVGSDPIDLFDRSRRSRIPSRRRDVEMCLTNIYIN